MGRGQGSAKGGSEQGLGFAGSGRESPGVALILPVTGGDAVRRRRARQALCGDTGLLQKEGDDGGVGLGRTVDLVQCPGPFSFSFPFLFLFSFSSFHFYFLLALTLHTKM